MLAFGTLSYRGQVSRLRHLGLAALASYDLPPARLDALTHMENTTFRVSAGGARYLLRIHRAGGQPTHQARTRAEVESEMAWLVALRRETPLQVPEPVPRRDGGLVTAAAVPGVPEPRLCVLLRWVEGRFLNAGLTPRHLEAVGRFTAVLHEHATTFRSPPGFTRGRIAEVTPETAGRARALIDDVLGGEHSRVAAAIEAVAAAQHALGEGPGVFGLIHADLHQGNYLFQHGAMRAIDFDDCGWGHFAYDLAVTLSEVDFFPAYPDLRAALLAGYRAVRPFPVADEQLVDAYRRYRKVQLALWFTEQRSHPGFADWEREARSLLASVAS